MPGDGRELLIEVSILTDERENDRKITDASGVAAKGNVFISDVRGQVSWDMNESSKIDNNVRIPYPGVQI